MGSKGFAVELYGNDMDLGGITLGSGSFTAYAKNNGGDVADITISDAIAKSVAGSSTLTLNADNNINSNYNIGSSNGALDINLAADYENNGTGDINLGAITLASRNGAINLNRPVVMTGANTWNAGTGTITTGSSVSMGANDLTMIADDASIGGNITGSGASVLTIRPFTNTQAVNLGGGAGGLNLNDTELGYLSGMSALVIGSTASIGDVGINTWNASSKSFDVQIFGKNVDVGGLILGGGDVTIYSKGGDVTVSANGTSNSAGDLNILTNGNITVNAALVNNGTGTMNLFAGWDGASAIGAPGAFDRDAVDLGLTARDITLGTNGRISSNGTGTSVLIVAKDDFINNSSSGVTAISAAGGRYLVYASHWDETIKGGLTGKNLYNTNYNSTPVSSVAATGSHFIFAALPTLTVRADDKISHDGAAVTYTYTLSGLVTGDLLADALSGTPTYTLGTRTINDQPIILGAGTLASSLGYNIVRVNGNLTYTGLGAVGYVPPVTPVENPLDTSIVNHATNLGKTSVTELTPASEAGGFGTVGQNTDTAAQAQNGDNGGESEEDSAEAKDDNKSNYDPRAKTGCLVSDGMTGGCLL
ncbi:MAG: hypothetical protein DI551_10795 [Micavibrio aeruginosavorus]|uniref:MBG domain-containing protein n=1 Tax=Micavibrio aeruginosavorus TaxID=349221 RepID=A0A2W5MZQ6_9BACT|nr:MAG: hypothetical protein DI551_10795 [Micavibrio aeruginosavorus]